HLLPPLPCLRSTALTHALVGHVVWLIIRDAPTPGEPGHRRDRHRPPPARRLTREYCAWQAPRATIMGDGRCRRTGTPAFPRPRAKRALTPKERMMDLRGVQVTWYGHGTFMLKTPAGKSILIDPWVHGNPACPDELKRLSKLDLMLVTHGH